MRLLLDTHVMIWWVQDNPRLRPRARALIADGEADLMFSVASCWEASVKARKGKIDVSGAQLWHAAVQEGIAILGIEAAHIAEMENLPKLADHGDPFDQILLAQAKAEGAALMTADRDMTRYGVPCIGVR